MKLWKYLKHDYYFNKFHTENTYTIFHYIKDLFYEQIRRIICVIMGHKIVDDSYAGPESGDVSLYCERCGWHWSHILY